MDGESTIVAFRHPGVGDEHIAALNADDLGIIKEAELQAA